MVRDRDAWWTRDEGQGRVVRDRDIPEKGKGARRAPELRFASVAGLLRSVTACALYKSENPHLSMSKLISSG